MKQLSPGQTFDCQYVIRRELGSGKHKIAYLADAIHYEKNWMGEYVQRRNPVVLKLMDSEMDAQGELSKMVRLRFHPNIPMTYVGTSLKPHPYVAEEFLDGKSLETRNNMISTENVCKQTANALTAAHATDIIHNDIHPGNIFLCGRRVKVTDFGNSLILGKTHPADHCKTKYRAPETFSDEPIPASDVWSLGVIMYEQFAGARPFEQDRQNMRSEEYQSHMREKILHEDPVWLRERAPSVKPRIEELVHAMLNKDPCKRPTAKEVHRALRWHFF